MMQPKSVCKFVIKITHMKYGCKFILEKRKDANGELLVEKLPLSADITFSGSRIRYFTGYRIDASRWNSETQQVNKNAFGYKGLNKIAYNEINSDITAVRAKVYDILNPISSLSDKKELTKVLDIVLKKSDKQAKDDFTHIFEKFLESSGFSKQRTFQMLQLQSFLSDFSNVNGLSFEKWKGETLMQFETYVRETVTIRKDGTVIRKGQNTISAIMKRCRAFFRWAYKNKHIKNYPFLDYSIPQEVYGKPVYLTKVERDLLEKAELKSEKLIRVRDLFVFQCFVGCRVGDFFSLTKSNVQDGILTYIPSKTSKESVSALSVPLSKIAKEILVKYDDEDERLLPFISEVKYNLYLKELFKVVGLDRPVTRFNQTTGKTDVVPLYSLATSHMARRTFVGTLYKKVKDDVIGSMSGHVKGSKAFARYYDIDEEMKQEAIDLLD
jgi:site-specific recombinase XerD